MNSTLNIKLPAVFGVANCTPLEKDALKFSAGRPSSSSSALSLTVGLDLKSECPPLSYTFQAASAFPIAKWLGISNFRRNNGTIAPINATNDTRSAAFHGKLGVPPHCPLSVAFLAQGSYTNKTGLLDITDSLAFACSPYVAQEQLNVTFSIPSFDLSSSHPPQPIPDTQTFFSEAELLNAGYFGSYLPFVRTVIDLKLKSLAADEVFQAMFGGVDGIPASSLFIADGKGKTLLSDGEIIQKLQDRIEKVYGIIVAQLYNNKQRSATLPQNAPNLFNGTIFTPAGSRVVQDEISTRVLQGILAAMTICAIVSMVMIDGRRLLPRNPCSIAAVASFFAHSSVLSEDVVPLTSESLESTDVFKHYLFSLGWWKRGEKAWYGTDVGKAEKDNAGTL
jgi:hypothetical protein